MTQNDQVFSPLIWGLVEIPSSIGPQLSIPETCHKNANLDEILLRTIRVPSMNVPLKHHIYIKKNGSWNVENPFSGCDVQHSKRVPLFVLPWSWITNHQIIHQNNWHQSLMPWSIQNKKCRKQKILPNQRLFSCFSCEETLVLQMWEGIYQNPLQNNLQKGAVSIRDNYPRVSWLKFIP